jgi:hypothetical protein
VVNGVRLVPRFRLCGRYAVEHARRVHAKIRRQLLRYDDVTAVDVGFAIHETENRYENVLAIRIHVQAKKSAETLQDKGLPVFTDLRYLGVTAARAAVAKQGSGFRDPDEGSAPLRAQVLDDLSRLPEPDGGSVAFQAQDVDAPTRLRFPRHTDAKPDSNLRYYLKYPITGVTPGDLSAYCYRRSERPLEGEPPLDCDETYKTPIWCCERCGCSCDRLCKCCWCCCRCCDGKHEGGATKERPCAACHDPETYCRLAICGVPLDVVQASYFPSIVRHPGGDFDEGVFVDRIGTTNDLTDEENLLTGRGRVSPLVGGISVGSVNGQAGTLSAVVWDRTDGSACVLGNWHVLAGSNRAKVGQVCYQPAIFDGGTTDDVIGHLKRWHIGELGDAALAELDGSRFFASGEVLGLYHPIAGYRRPELNLELRKWGRTTGFTEGFIDGIELSTNIEYGEDQVRHFEHQFHVAPLLHAKDVSQRGDSGALLVTAYDLDDLDVIATGILQQRRPLLECLAEILGPPRADQPAPAKPDGGDPKPRCSIESIEALAEVVRELLESEARRCLKPLSTSPPDAGSELGAMIRLIQPALGGEPDCEGRAPDGVRAEAASGAGTTAQGGGTPKDDPAKKYEDFKHLLFLVLEEHGFDLKDIKAKKQAKEDRRARNAYYAVGMIFAGDTPGSPFGEFALASDISLLAKDLRFSLRPVFEPRSSFRRLRKRADGFDPDPGQGGHGRGRGPARQPGAQGADPRGGGPQPDGETLQSTGPGQSGGG